MDCEYWSLLDLGDSWSWTWAGFKRPDHNTVTLGGDGSLISEDVWMNREETLKNMRTDTFISRRWVSLSDSGQCEVAWYMVTQSGLCPGLQPIWEERRLNLYHILLEYEHEDSLGSPSVSSLHMSNFITRGVQKNLSTFFLFLQLKSKLVLRSRGVWNIDKTYGKPDVCQNNLSNAWLAKAEYQELLTQRSLHNQHYRIKTGKNSLQKIPHLYGCNAH